MQKEPTAQIAEQVKKLAFIVISRFEDHDIAKRYSQFN